VLDQRGQLLRAALGFAGLPRLSYDTALWALRTWLDSWAGIGRVAFGMARQRYDLQLTKYAERGLLAVEFAILWAAAAIIHHIQAVGSHAEAAGGCRAARAQKRSPREAARFRRAE
jgi:hypothetical protein